MRGAALHRVSTGSLRAQVRPQQLPFRSPCIARQLQIRRPASVRHIQRQLQCSAAWTHHCATGCGSANRSTLDVSAQASPTAHPALSAPSDEHADDNALMARLRGVNLRRILLRPECCRFCTRIRDATIEHCRAIHTAHTKGGIAADKQKMVPRHAGLLAWLNRSNPPKWLWRTISALILGGQVMTRMLQGALSAYIPLACRCIREEREDVSNACSTCRQP